MLLTPKIYIKYFYFILTLNKRLFYNLFISNTKYGTLNYLILGDHNYVSSEDRKMAIGLLKMRQRRPGSYMLRTAQNSPLKY